MSTRHARAINRLASQANSELDRYNNACQSLGLRVARWEDISSLDTPFWRAQATMSTHKFDVLRVLMNKLRAQEEIAVTDR